jgi:Flp pilus assembly protein TadG
MESSYESLQLLYNLCTQQQKLSNSVATASLALELCGTPRNMTDEDFQVLQQSVTMAINALYGSQEILRLLSSIFSNTLSNSFSVLKEEGAA